MLTAGRSTVLITEFDITRIAVTNPAVADAVVVKPREILVDGKGAGTVSLIVWGADTRKHYDVVVDPGVTNLQQNFQQLFPGEDINVAVTDEAVDPVGRVSSNDVMLRAGELRQGGDAEALGDQHAGAAERLAEQAGDAAGAFRRSEPQRPAGVGPGAVRAIAPTSRGRVDHRAVRRRRTSTSDSRRLEFTDFLNIFLFSRTQGIGGVLKALQGRGFLQSLAEPNLIAYNGQEASFLAGGEIPIPLVTGLGQVSGPVQGVRRSAQLHADHRRRRDPAEAASRGQHARLHQRHHALGLPHPGAEHAAAETDVELRDGQSFAIAGLLNNLSQTDRQSIPSLSRVPIIGTLFKSQGVSVPSRPN